MLILVVVVTRSPRLNAPLHVTLVKCRVHLTLLHRWLESILASEVILDRRQSPVPSCRIVDVDETGWVLDYVWLYGSECFSKLSEAELGVSIQVESPHDGYEFRLEGLVSSAFQKASN